MNEPKFGNGSGWYRSGGLAMPGSTAEREARRAAAYPCTVYLMREHGMRVPAIKALERTPTAGLLVCEERAAWCATLYDPAMQSELLFLADAKLVRDERRCRVYQGMEREDGKPRWLQSWFCAPSIEHGRRVLEDLAARESWKAND